MDKRVKIILSVNILAIIAVFLIILAIKPKKIGGAIETYPQIDTTTVSNTDDMELVEVAIIWQESKGNFNPKRSDGASEGILQLTPIYVKEANRILGKSKYTLYDRKNPLKSHEMFLVVQNYHNPEKDVKKAVILHNKGKRYFDEVIDRYNCLKLYQEILIFKNK